MTTPALQAAVRRAYEVFRMRKAPGGPLNVCTSCCMPEELEREMRALPLRRITTRHFYEYCNGAMGNLVQPAEEIKYLLPRWLELLATGEATHLSPELALDRVGRCPPGSFNAAESGVLDEFMLAYFDHQLNGGGFWGWSGDPLSLLVMADAGGRAVEPLLQCWLNHQNPLSTTQFVRSTYWDFWPKFTHQRLCRRPSGAAGALQALDLGTAHSSSFHREAASARIHRPSRSSPNARRNAVFAHGGRGARQLVAQLKESPWNPNTSTKTSPAACR